MHSPRDLAHSFIDTTIDNTMSNPTSADASQVLPSRELPLLPVSAQKRKAQGDHVGRRPKKMSEQYKESVARGKELRDAGLEEDLVIIKSPSGRHTLGRRYVPIGTVPAYPSLGDRSSPRKSNTSAVANPFGVAAFGIDGRSGTSSAVDDPFGLAAFGIDPDLNDPFPEALDSSEDEYDSDGSSETGVSVLGRISSQANEESVGLEAKISEDEHEAEATEFQE
ncbi:hypothetical protein D9611_005563 [Ephemerocybe angulata]|uniref:Uncharacterized protein n=1 Tax=Ephemerocybe angulata TaxID=980116 RepID=A0A8H5F4F2_9AGAR|nr:hypothetical protein D9611_005563 [Tulosesus angulatus]